MNYHFVQKRKQMPLMDVNPGKAVPEDINVVIEIPAYSDPVKYEIDKDTGALFVDRFMGTSMQYLDRSVLG